MNFLIIRNVSIYALSLMMLYSCSSLPGTQKSIGKSETKPQYKKINEVMTNKRVFLYEEWLSNYEDILNTKCNRIDG